MGGKWIAQATRVFVGSFFVACLSAPLVLANEPPIPPPPPDDPHPLFYGVALAVAATCWLISIYLWWGRRQRIRVPVDDTKAR